MRDWRFWLAEQRGTLMALAIFGDVRDLRGKPSPG